MNLQALDSLRTKVHNSYLSFLLDGWELDIRPRSKLVMSHPRRIEITCFSDRDGRIPLGAPLSYTIVEAANFGPAELERMLDHIRISINMNKLI
jgi:hypothetical protein